MFMKSATYTNAAHAFNLSGQPSPYSSLYLELNSCAVQVTVHAVAVGFLQASDRLEYQVESEYMLASFFLFEHLVEFFSPPNADHNAIGF